MQTTVTIPRPDDWHTHLRDGDYLATTVPHTAERFARTVVMPNLKSPVTAISDAESYYQRILQHVPSSSMFQPLMTLYLTDETTPALIAEAAAHPLIFACKLYPAGATTNSASGVNVVDSLYPVFAAMEQTGLPLLIHGEVTDPTTDIFDRERLFIDTILHQVIKHFPALRIVLEHITTQYAVEFIKQQANHVSATITVHHMYLNRNDLLVGGIHPDYYCLPIVKCESDRNALLQVALSGHRQFFLGTDSAPHPTSAKYSSCGCAGVYTAHAAIELVTQLFANNHALDHLANFTSINGAHFYQLPINTETMTLEQCAWQIPETYRFGNEQVTPFYAGKTIQWQIKT